MTINLTLMPSENTLLLLKKVFKGEIHRLQMFSLSLSVEMPQGACQSGTMTPAIENVPVSRNFDHFRDMRMNSLQLNYMTHAGIRHPIVYRSLSTTLKRESPAADILTVGTSRNVRRRLPIGNHDVVDRTCVPVSRIFQRFRDMPTNNVEPEYIIHTYMRYLPFTKHGFNEFKLNEQHRA